MSKEEVQKPNTSTPVPTPPDSRNRKGLDLPKPNTTERPKK